jgi:hypothetical protein
LVQVGLIDHTREAGPALVREALSSGSGYGPAIAAMGFGVLSVTTAMVFFRTSFARVRILLATNRERTQTATSARRTDPPLEQGISDPDD